MTEEDRQEIRNIIAEELSWLIKIDRLVIPKEIQILNGRNFQFGRSFGTQFGTASDQRMAWWGKTPLTQPVLVPKATGGTVIDVQARAAVNSVIASLEDIGILAD